MDANTNDPVAKEQPAIQRRRSDALADSDSDLHHGQRPKSAAVQRKQRMVTVTIEKNFKLTRDDGKEVQYLAGVDDMPQADAEHWYSKIHGVKLYVAGKKEE